MEVYHPYISHILLLRLMLLLMHLLIILLSLHLILWRFQFMVSLQVLHLLFEALQLHLLSLVLKVSHLLCLPHLLQLLLFNLKLILSFDDLIFDPLVHDAFGLVGILQSVHGFLIRRRKLVDAGYHDCLC